VAQCARTVAIETNLRRNDRNRAGLAFRANHKYTSKTGDMLLDHAWLAIRFENVHSKKSAAAEAAAFGCGPALS
jgi:hypothetical protein